MKFNKKKLKIFRYLHPKLMRLILLIAILIVAAITLFMVQALPVNLPVLQSDSEDTIKWVDFDVPYKVLEKTMFLDIESYETENHLKWTEMLAYLGTKYAGILTL